MNTTGSNPSPAFAGCKAGLMASALIATTSVFFLNLAVTVKARDFVNREGQSMNAEVLNVGQEKARLRRADGRVFDIPLSTLSEQDAAYLREWATKNAALLPTGFGKFAVEPPKGEGTLPLANWQIVGFIRERMGKRVGDGLCWALANEAFLKVKLQRPGTGLRVWGRLIDPTKEKLLPGDIGEIERGPDAKWPNHTFVLYEWQGDDSFVIAEQNFNSRLYITTRKFVVSSALKSKTETFRFYRPGVQ